MLGIATIQSTFTDWFTQKNQRATRDDAGHGAKSSGQAVESHRQHARLTLDVTRQPGPVPTEIFHLAGVLDGRTYEQLMTWAKEAYDQGNCQLVLDLSGVERIATSGLYALHAIAALFRGEGMPAADGWNSLRQLAHEGQRGAPHGAVAVANARPAVARLLLAGGIDKVMPLQ
jgi:ABC-type transporter Mla MlaB component